MAKPSIYEELYVGRFLKAALLKGKKVTLTIKDVDVEMLMGEDGKEKSKAILSFVERPMQHVMPRTNALCIKAMFGNQLKDWIGRRVTLFEGNWNGEPCIRVWGSPDIKKDMSITVELPRRKPIPMTLHAVKEGPVAATTGETQMSVDPRILTAWEILGWTADERVADRQKFTGTEAEYLARVNGLVDERDARESA